MTFSEFSSWKGPSREGQWTKMVLISLGLHLLILAFFLNIFPQGGAKIKREPAYFVNLVSAPGEETGGTKIKESLATPSPPPNRVETKPIFLPKPVIKKVPDVKEDHTKELEQALDQLKKKVTQQKSLEKKLGQLEKKVNEDQALEKALARIEGKQSTPTAVTRPGGSGPGTIASSVPGSQDGLGMEFQLYHASVRSRIKKNWVLPEGLLKKSDISAEIMIRINRNGRIEDSRFERRSGLEAFDQEVIRTIKKSDPLPSLPPGYPKSSYEVILTFHSKDLSGN
jgi:colicin import membrane protein